MQMNKLPALLFNREDVANSLDINALGNELETKVQNVLQACNKQPPRKGTFFTFKFTLYTILALCMRRDLNQHAAVSWMISTFRWLTCQLPARLFAEGTLTHARMRLGSKVFLQLFHATAELEQLPADFHGRSSVSFDGCTCSMIDTPENRQAFGRGSTRNGETGFPQLRMMAMLSVPLRKVLRVEYDAYTGKGTGERRLLTRILHTVQCNAQLLFLLDAGLYSFELFEDCRSNQHEFIIKTPAHIKPKPIKDKRFADGSYLATLGKGKKTLTVRVIHVQIQGFRTTRLITNILDETISARELAIHYHQRWDIEIAFDEIKTHQCAVQRGHAATVFRSKIPELVVQELYAMLVVYNCIRGLMSEAADIHNKNPLLLSFLDTLQFMIEALPNLAFSDDKRTQYNYLLYLISESDIDRPKRHRINPRVVKVKSSKFMRKKDEHRSVYRNLEKDLSIVQNFA